MNPLRIPTVSSYVYGVRVKLRDDLTSYHLSLKAGTEGVTIPPAGEYARYGGRFVSVQFPETVLDCLLEGLEEIKPGQPAT
jgi:hypothetical protein